MKKLFQLGLAFFGILVAQYGYSQDYQGPVDGQGPSDGASCCCEQPACPPEQSTGDCWCLMCKYEPCYYNQWRCCEEPRYYSKKCCRRVPQYYQVQKCRYVPQYYCEQACRYVPEYYCVQECKMCKKWVCDRKCKYVPKYYWKHNCAPQNACCPSQAPAAPCCGQ